MSSSITKDKLCISETFWLLESTFHLIGPGIQPAAWLTDWTDQILVGWNMLKRTRAQRRSTASRISSWWPTRLTASSSRSWWEIFNSCWPSIFSFSKFGMYCWRLSSSPERNRERETSHKEAFSESVIGLAYFDSVRVLNQTQRRWVNKRYLLWPDGLLVEIFFTSQNSVGLKPFKLQRLTLMRSFTYTEKNTQERTDRPERRRKYKCC